MSVTFVAQTLHRDPFHVGTSAVCDRPAGVVANDLLLALAYSFTDATVTPPAGWGLLTTQSCTGLGIEVYNHVYYKIAGSSEPGTYTFSVPTNHDPFGLPWVRISAWRGCSQSEPIFTIASEDLPADDDLSWSSLTSTVDGSMLICMASSDATLIWNAQAGWIVFDHDELLAYKALPTAGATGAQTHSHGPAQENGKVGVMLVLESIEAGYRYDCNAI